MLTFDDLLLHSCQYFDINSVRMMELVDSEGKPWGGSKNVPEA